MLPTASLPPGSRRGRRLLPALAGALLLAGCAASAGQGDVAHLDAYRRAQPCCDDPAAFRYEDLPPAGRLTRTIDATSPLFEFQSGRSHFAAFRLPAGSEPYRVRIKSLFAGPPGPAGHVFYPVVALLDADGFVSRVTGLDNLRLDQAIATAGGASGLAVTVPLDPRQAPERYLIVFTPAALLGEAPAERREGDLLTAATLAWMQRRAGALVEPSPYGQLEISVIPGLPLVEGERRNEGD